MANMGYCRFENTVRDLEDCYNHMDDDNLSDTEKNKRAQMIDLCKNISNDYEHEMWNEE